ncbi:unnamed protein product [Pseudo-nitzschia multistriata]|uniref:Uncharacterized protein n=1 Tax=Pseudo-nitzschia multistriata TaxID=183589 RepID=A0A448Z6N9_9STRA|nr:unnamed protein product [Pseudo-nitzschia multistriata]
MKLQFNLWWVSIHVGAISAFTPNLSRPSSFSKNRFAGSRNEKTQLFESDSPHPPEYPPPDYPTVPDYPPRVDEQLELDLIDSERRVMLYEKEVEMIREQLDLKQMELLEEQNIFRDEKRSLMNTIAEFTSILARRDEELSEAIEKREEPVVDLEKQKELEDTIKALEQKLQEKTDSLEFEKQSSNELRNRFEDAADALEYEQMNFEKERKVLQDLVTQERLQVKALEEKYEENGKSFETAQKELLKKIKDEETKLSDTKANWKATQEQLKTVKQRLEASLQEKEKILKDSQMKLDTENAALSTQIAGLKEELKNERVKMEEIKSGLEKENQEFAKSKSTLQSQIETEEKLIANLKNQMDEEKVRYESERSTLNQAIEGITKNLTSVEKQLADERVNFSKEKKMLEQKLADEIRVGRLKKKQMKVRYDEIRREMTDLWQSSKRQARQEQDRLRKKYGRKLDTVQAQVSRLEGDLVTEKKRLVEGQAKMEARHAEEIKSRDLMVTELEGSVTALRKVIVDKDLIIKEKSEQIQRYETSFRQLARLGLVVTGNKIKKVAGPLKRLIENSPPDEIE